MVDRPTLFADQRDVVDRTRARVAAGIKRPLVCAATAFGKTLCMAEVARLASEKLKPVVILSPRRELVRQTVKTLSRLGLHSGVIMAGEPYMPLSNIQVVCTPTLHARAVQRGKIPFPKAAVVLVDEAHLSLAPTVKHILEQYQDAVHIGWTATPARGDGKGLGDMYDEIVFGPPVEELIQNGRLVRPRYFTPPKFDVKGVPIVKGDYSQKQLGEVVDKKTLVGDVVTNWLRIAPTRKTVVFGVTQAHAKHLQEAFLAAGIKAGYVDSETELAERSATLDEFNSPESDMRVICNVGVLSYGWDSPIASCAVLARPTKSIVMYFQAVGRVLRAFPGKQDAIVIDHGGIVEELGFIEDPVDWTLNGKKNIGKERAERTKEEAKAVKCEQCEATFRYAAQCPECGWKVPPRKPKAMDVVDADLVELTRTQRRINREWSLDQKAQFYGELLLHAHAQGYSEGWASHKYKERLGVWPNAVKSGTTLPTIVSPETSSWIRSRQIAWARSKHNPRNNGGGHVGGCDFKR